MTQLTRICSRFPETELGELQDRPLFHVRRRRIAIYNPEDAPFRKRWAGYERSPHFATSQNTFRFLETDQRFYASPHHGFRGWLGLGINDTTDWQEVAELLLWSYRHVANRSLVQELGTHLPGSGDQHDGK